MKVILSLAILLCGPAWGKIIVKKGEYYVVNSKGKNIPMSLNALVKTNKAKSVELFDEGNVHIMKAALNGGKAQLYSIGEDGFYYSLKPFSGFTVKSVEKGKITFKEQPKSKYIVNDKGLFILTQ